MKTYKFTATIEEAPNGGAYVLFPYDTEKEFGTRGKVPVKVTFNGVPYTGSLVKYGHPQHMLPILKAIREEAGKRPGDTVRVELQKDEQLRTLEVPPELQSAMKEAGVLPFFERLSYTNRKEYCRWIAGAKKEETRSKRLVKAVSLLKNGVRTPDGAGSPG